VTTIPKMSAEISPKTSVAVYPPPRRHIPKDSPLHKQSNICFKDERRLYGKQPHKSVRNSVRFSACQMQDTTSSCSSCRLYQTACDPTPSPALRVRRGRHSRRAEPYCATAGTNFGYTTRTSA